MFCVSVFVFLCFMFRVSMVTELTGISTSYMTRCEGGEGGEGVVGRWNEVGGAAGLG